MGLFEGTPTRSMLHSGARCSLAFGAICAEFFHPLSPTLYGLPSMLYPYQQLVDSEKHSLFSAHKLQNVGGWHGDVLG